MSRFQVFCNQTLPDVMANLHVLLTWQTSSGLVTFAPPLWDTSVWRMNSSLSSCSAATSATSLFVSMTAKTSLTLTCTCGDTALTLLSLIEKSQECWKVSVKSYLQGFPQNQEVFFVNMTGSSLGHVIQSVPDGIPRQGDSLAGCWTELMQCHRERLKQKPTAGVTKKKKQFQKTHSALIKGLWSGDKTLFFKPAARDEKT